MAISYTAQPTANILWRNSLKKLPVETSNAIYPNWLDIMIVFFVFFFFAQTNDALYLVMCARARFHLINFNLSQNLCVSVSLNVHLFGKKKLIIPLQSQIKFA